MANYDENSGLNTIPADGSYNEPTQTQPEPIAYTGDVPTEPQENTAVPSQEVVAPAPEGQAPEIDYRAEYEKLNLETARNRDVVNMLKLAAKGDAGSLAQLRTIPGLMPTSEPQAAPQEEYAPNYPDTMEGSDFTSDVNSIAGKTFDARVAEIQQASNARINALEKDLITLLTPVFKERGNEQLEAFKSGNPTYNDQIHGAKMQETMSKYPGMTMGDAWAIVNQGNVRQDALNSAEAQRIKTIEQQKLAAGGIRPTVAGDASKPNLNNATSFLDFFNMA